LSDQRLAERWASVRARGSPALIPYITAGFPDAAATLAMLKGMERAGADMVELGIPWSDPVADGPVIQASTHAALAGGTSLKSVLGLLKESRCGVPVIVFSYLNPILAMGASRFAAAAKDAGAAGVLVTDLPAGADAALESELRSTGLPLVRLVAPTSTKQRIAEIAGASDGFVYLVARTGVTGARTEIGADLKQQLAAVRAATRLPVAVGFGITATDQAAMVGALADGVVVGSALVERMRSSGSEAALAWLAELRRALDGARRAA
jgi:tryptophan synthase alpha chain